MHTHAPMQDVLQKLSFTAAGELSPMAAMFGGIVGQEVMKAASGKFHPLYQFFYFDSIESLPDEALSPEDVAPRVCCIPNSMTSDKHSVACRTVHAALRCQAIGTHVQKPKIEKTVEYMLCPLSHAPWCNMCCLLIPDLREFIGWPFLHALAALLVFLPCFPADDGAREAFAMQGDRYDAQRAVIGSKLQDKLQDMQVLSMSCKCYICLYSLAE